MLKQGKDYSREREKALADGLRDVASELRLVDPADFIAFLRTEQFGNIRNLVNSSTEMFFKPGTITFGLSGEVDLPWDRAPSVSLDMEFHHLNVSAYFRLVLEAFHAGVDLSYVSFEGGSDDPDKNTCRLVEAIEDARVVPRSRGSKTASQAGASADGDVRL
ncbi:hypothetical protein W911_04025 [Hyphomicrobium nitrativorans NL23]|uniref:Uncharacterized protein n=1 Tax=Hyphomicrobium nitrativorans NL23 TaxID=1029756 RepID=V5SB93_9HYPH|nr:hypothetical protein [Hyphomicrobium nitrativorans]AHB47762.1 hypothetical protein W911_04025 [Hyphomicrobium nitrativorans NL23]